MIPGVDVSHHQGEIDWQRVRAAGIRFAWIRTGDGLSTLDTEWTRNWREARFHGLTRGAYHFLRCGASGAAQAEVLCRRIGELHPDDLPPACDLEEGSIGAGVAPRQAVDCALAFAGTVERELGRAPVLYTTPNTIALLGHEAHRLQGRFPTLWISHVETAKPRVPPPYLAWAFWQWSWTGRVDGVGGKVDLNWFAGDEQDLQRLIMMSEVMAS